MSQTSGPSFGYADVWWRGKFGWEYKRRGKYRDLSEAYRQLLQYREALENPPLLEVSDIARIEIHTNFTGTIKQVHSIALADLAEPENLTKLRRVFTDPDSFRPQVTTQRGRGLDRNRRGPARRRETDERVLANVLTQPKSRVGRIAEGR